MSQRLRQKLVKLDGTESGPRMSDDKYTYVFADTEVAHDYASLEQNKMVIPGKITTTFERDACTVFEAIVHILPERNDEVVVEIEICKDDCRVCTNNFTHKEDAHKKKTVKFDCEKIPRSGDQRSVLNGICAELSQWAQGQAALLLRDCVECEVESAFPEVLKYLEERKSSKWIEPPPYLIDTTGDEYQNISLHVDKLAQTQGADYDGQALRKVVAPMTAKFIVMKRYDVDTLQELDSLMNDISELAAHKVTRDKLVNVLKKSKCLHLDDAQNAASEIMTMINSNNRDHVKEFEKVKIKTEKGVSAGAVTSPPPKVPKIVHSSAVNAFKNACKKPAKSKKTVGSVDANSDDDFLNKLKSNTLRREESISYDINFKELRPEDIVLARTTVGSEILGCQIKSRKVCERYHELKEQHKEFQHLVANLLKRDSKQGHKIFGTNSVRPYKPGGDFVPTREEAKRVDSILAHHKELSKSKAMEYVRETMGMGFEWVEAVGNMLEENIDRDDVMCWGYYKKKWFISLRVPQEHFPDSVLSEATCKAKKYVCVDWEGNFYNSDKTPQSVYDPVPKALGSKREVVTVFEHLMRILDPNFRFDWPDIKEESEEEVPVEESTGKLSHLKERLDNLDKIRNMASNPGPTVDLASGEIAFSSDDDDEPPAAVPAKAATRGKGRSQRNDYSIDNDENDEPLLHQLEGFTKKKSEEEKEMARSSRRKPAATKSGAAKFTQNESPPKSRSARAKRMRSSQSSPPPDTPVGPNSPARNTDYDLLDSPVDQVRTRKARRK